MNTPEQWLKKFYPTPASKTKGKPLAEIVQHSLTKWRGALELADFGLRKHRSYPWVLDSRLQPNSLEALVKFDTSTCSLCVNFHDMKPGTEGSMFCQYCPVREVNGSKNCNEQFVRWCDYEDARPMVELLEKTLAFVQRTEIQSKPEEGN